MAEEVARLVAVMEAQLRGFTKGMEQAQREADRRFGAIEKRMRTTEAVFAGGFKNIGGLAARYLGAAAIIAFTRNLLAQADALQDTAQQLNLTTQEFQGLLSVARDTGAGVEGMKRGLATLTDQLGDAAKGEGELAKLMRELNIPLGTTMQVLFDLADATAKAETQNEKMRISTTAFGRSGKELVPVLDQTADGIRRGLDEAQKRGQIWDPETITQLGNAHDAFERLKVTLTGMIANPFADIVKGVDEFVQHLSRLPANISRNFAQIGQGGLIFTAQPDRSMLPPGAVGPGSPPPTATTGSAPRTAVPPSPEQTNTAANAAKKAAEDELSALEEIHGKIAEAQRDALTEELAAKQEISDKIIDFQRSAAEEELAAWEEIQNKIVEAQNLVADEKFAKATEFADSLRDAFDITGAAGIRAFDNIGDAAEQALQQIAAMAFQLGVMEPILNALFGKKGDPLGGIVGSLFSGIGGGSGPAIAGRAGGGTVSAGRPYMVGERGRELFVPNVNGTIIPNIRAGGGGGVVQNHFHLEGAVVTQDLVDQMNAISQRNAAMEGRVATVRGAGLASRHATQNLQQQRRMTG